MPENAPEIDIGAGLAAAFGGLVAVLKLKGAITDDDIEMARQAAEVLAARSGGPLATTFVASAFEAAAALRFR